MDKKQIKSIFKKFKNQNNNKKLLINKFKNKINKKIKKTYNLSNLIIKMMI